VFRIKTMTSLILDPIVTDYLSLGINTGEKDMFLELSKDKIIIVLELSQDRSRLIAHLAVLHFVDHF
jgi:hypothetical protein